MTADLPETFYITTPIYYVNDVPHLGHAYTTIVADTFARYYRRQGVPTYFVTGTDEHGQKIQRAAEAKGQTPQQLADEVVQRFQGLWDALGITHDDFIRTTETRHKDYVQQIWQKMEARGDIYKDTYSGWYSVADEAYFTDKEIEDQGIDKATLEFREEESYFFRLSAYQQPLLDYFERNPGFVQPESRYNEVRRFVEGGLQDLSISRTAIDWGIPVPDDPRHVMYVWLDALSNYISVLGGDGSDMYRRFWPASIHLIGKDILRFHAVYWPAFLLSAELPLPQTVLTHGWWTIEGQKMSKRLRNVVDPYFLIEEYDRDVVRYFVLREVPLGQDGDFSHENLLNRLNADLANDLGNLVSRTAGMVHKYFAGQLRIPEGPIVQGTADLYALLNAKQAQVDECLVQALRPDRALDAIWEAIRETNRYIDSAEPWNLAKAEQMDALAVVLGAAANAIVFISTMLDPFMPDTAAEVRRRYQSDDMPVGADWTYRDLPQQFSALTVEKAPPLFPRLDEANIKKKLERIEMMTGATSSAPDSADAQPQIPQITIEHFFETRLVVGRVLAAQAVPKSNKLLQLSVDLGEPEPRTIVSGIAKRYQPDEMVDKHVIVVANLKPAKLMGIESNGMVLAGETDEGVCVVEPDPAIPVGTQIK